MTGPDWDTAWGRPTPSRPILGGNHYLFYLPAYAPELNAVEPVFRAVKHLDLPDRRDATAAELEEAVDTAIARINARVLGQDQEEPRLAPRWRLKTLRSRRAILA